MKLLYFLTLSLFLLETAQAQVGTNGMSRSEEGRPVKEYNLAIKKEDVTLAGVTAHAMTINGQIPGPTLEFNEGDLAIINVTNEMKEPSSVHWHGIILPNFYDGVPFMTTPPIAPGQTFQYRIPINQSGTYWYHSHTMLQEQKGVFGSIVIHPKEEKLQYDKELVVVLSDWTNEKPMNVLRNLKRGSDWYQVKKGTAMPLGRVIAQKGLGAQFKFWRDRMESPDIADIYYPAFLTNGQSVAEYPDFKAGEKVRLRFINACASSYYWLDFGGGNPMIVSSDGIDVEPVHKSRLLFAIAETYDIIVTIPDGTLEINATVQDGSGHTTLRLGSGKLYPAQIFPRPDKVDMMKQMSAMDMKMGAPALIGNKKKNSPEVMASKYGMKMQMDGMHDMHDMTDMKNMDMGSKNHDHQNMQSKDDMSDMNDKTMRLTKQDSMHMHHMDDDSVKMNSNEHDEMNHDQMNHGHMNQDQKYHMNHGNDMSSMDHSEMDMDNMDKSQSNDFNYSTRRKYFNYNFLKAKQSTKLPDNIPITDLLLNLTGNMNRYVWTLNGIPLSEADKINVKKGEITRITMNNLTMMHHPMHLHGHYFRVINENGERSPLKHTVNVAPMQKVVIEVYNEETEDWFFHCHVLYHMMSGMARVYSYGSPRDPRMQNYPLKTLIKESNPYFFWGLARAGSNYSELNLTASNLRNAFSFRGEMGKLDLSEIEFNYDRYINSYFRVYLGVNSEIENPDSSSEFTTVGLIGIKYFTPYMFMLDLSVDNTLRPRIRLDRDFLLFPKFFFEWELEYKPNFRFVNDANKNPLEHETQWTLGASYMLSRNFSLQGNYNNLYGWGGGLLIRF